MHGLHLSDLTDAPTPPCCQPVITQRPERLLLVVVGFYLPAEALELQRIVFHILGAGLAQGFIFLPGTAHMQRRRIRRTEKQSTASFRRERDIGMHGLVTEDVCYHSEVPKVVCSHLVGAGKIVKR